MKAKGRIYTLYMYFRLYHCNTLSVDGTDQKINFIWEKAADIDRFKVLNDFPK